mmetsp:Transcript_103191/g.291380  ORF Transcript_103191/g.291380 Transcript_103191/m.291380 type:complete len:246 (+) Transcript_103191:155-892(+)
MLLYNADVDESERNYRKQDDLAGEEDDDDDNDDGVRRSFFDLRQRTLLGLDQLPAFRVVALGLLRKLRTNLRGAILYGEVEDAMARYFRLLDNDMQRFASLHETLRDAADKLPQEGLLLDGMREIAVVLLACGEMQRKALDLKLSAQRSASMSDVAVPPLASFERFAIFLENALAVSDQLRKKHEELQQLRMRAWASAMDSRAAAASTCAAAAPPSTDTAATPGAATCAGRSSAQGRVASTADVS